MSATEQNFEVRRGDDAPMVAFALWNADGTPAVAPLSWTWKYATSPDGPAIGTKAGTNFVSVLMNGTTFLAVPIQMTSSDTAPLNRGQTYFHELEVTTAAGRLTTPSTGRMFVSVGGMR